MGDKEAVKKLIKLLTGYKKLIVFILICMLFSTGLNLLMPLFSKSIMDEGFIGGNKTLLITLVILSACIYICNALINIINEKNRINISSKIEYSLSEEAFTHLFRIRLDYFNKTNYAEILNIIQTDIGNIISIADKGMFFLVSQIFSIMGGIIGLFIINYKLAFMVLLFIPIKYIVMKYFAKKRKEYVDQYIVDMQDYAKWFGDAVGGIKEIKLFNVTDFKYQEFCKKQRLVIEQKKKMYLIGEYNNSTETIIIQLLIMIVYIIGANMVFSLEATIGSIFAFITYSCYVTGPISSILNIGYMFSGVIPSVKRFYQFMEIEEEEDEQKAQKQIMQGDLEFKDVFFSYGTDKAVLNKVNITFPQRSKTVLLGQNGSGKSTILGLITRLYEPSQGTILLNGIDISSLHLKEYRSLIAVVSQQVYLFDDSIKNNICLYKNIDEDKLKEIIRDSELEEFINEVGLDYMVGYAGGLLSGGQKQKIALARALIHDKPIIIFDEATSSIDVQSEIRINKLIKTKLKDKTVIISSHKREVLNEVDYVIYLENGEAILQTINTYNKTADI